LSSQEKRTSIDILSSQPTGILVLENGTSFFGYGIGYQGSAVGEICFNTSITGYQEIITDPSYSDQIINFTFPHIGNVGTNLEDIESEKIWLKGVIFANEITEPSNYRSLEKLNQWLAKHKIVGLVGIDSRKLTNLIRNNGALKATIVNEKNNLDEKTYLEKCQNWSGLKGMELTEKVTTKEIYQWSDESLWDKKNGYNKNKEYKYNIVVLDFGVKKNILRNFSNLKAKVTVVPSTTKYNVIKDLNPDGIFLSNGPGDPAATFEIVKNTLSNILKDNVPVFGICLGHQLLAHALGCKTKKMHQGHRGANHPVKNLDNNTVEITSQNHGFEVDQNSIPSDVKISHISLFDKSIEGIESKSLNAFSVQYHPESSPGPHDSNYLFKKFIEKVENHAKKN
jgi:carbamoyl-phosphate synthase small subunit